MGDLEWLIRLPPDQRDSRKRELHRLPRGLECLQELLPTAWGRRLANAEVWGKSCGEARLLIIRRKGILQGCLQSNEGLAWLWGEPDGRLSKSVRERPEGCESHLQCSALPADLQQPG